MKLYLPLIAGLLLSQALLSQNKEPEIVTNNTIIQLKKAELSSELIKAKIQSSTCNFDLSTGSLINLKKAGVQDEIISYMFQKQNSSSNTLNNLTPENDLIQISQLTQGLYFYDSAMKTYSEIDPSILTNQKTGGFGESLKRSITGLFNSTRRASLSGKEANLKSSALKPIFIFIFDTLSKGFSNSNTYWGNVQSPNEFFLVKLTVVKNSREIVVGKENNIKTDIGIADEIKIPFTVKKIKKGGVLFYVRCIFNVRRPNS
ncbi:MAG: hypothetical protein J0L56_14385 [Chitinophagales bacterium]|nr:hypothetical protein [Chitinophagales bacterium]